MLVLSVNARGLATALNRQTLFRALRASGADIVLLQETSCPDLRSAVFWGKQWNPDPLKSYWTVHRDPVTQALAAGVAILISKKCDAVVDPASVVLDNISGRFISLCFRLQGWSFLLVNVYAPNDAPARAQFFDSARERMLDVLPDPTEADSEVDPVTEVIVGGDFNMVLDPALDRVGGAAGGGTGGSAEMLELMQSLALRDPWREANPGKVATTWRPDNVHMGARLDRILCTGPLAALATASIADTPIPRLDHLPVSINFDLSRVTRGPGYWMLNTSLLRDERYIAIIRDVLADAIPFLDSPQCYSLTSGWDYLKARVSTVSQSYGAAKARAAKRDKAKAIAVLAEVEQWWNEDPALYAPLLLQARAALDAISAREYEGAAVRARLRWKEDGERPTRYFCSLERGRQQDATITELTTARGPVTEPRAIARAAGDFYRVLLAEDDPISAEAQDALLGALGAERMLDDEERDICDLPLTLDELQAVLTRSARNRSPGCDGLPYEFYRVFWDELGPTLLRVLRASLEAELLPVSCRLGVIKLLFKKGDRKDLRNWRPLSMLCTDYKILAACFAARLSSVANKLILPEQTGFMSGRHIGSNILLVQGVLDLAEEGCVIMLDQEKAYDRVCWSFLRRALERYGFGPAFRAAISTLYKDSMSCVQVNGWTSGKFALERSVRQGDPLSPILYNLIDNFLAAAIMGDPAYAGLQLQLPAPCPKIASSLYADDKTFFARDEADLTALARWLHTYCGATGARVNWTKSRGLWLSADEFPIPASMSSLQWVPFGQLVTYLGVPVGRDASLTAVWDEVAAKMESTLALWRPRTLSSRGRLTVLRSLATSRLWHLASVCPVPVDTLKRMARAVWTFFWKGKRAGAVRREVCVLAPELGGLGMFDVAGVIKALHMQWLVRLLQPAAAAWKSIAWAMLGRAAPAPFSACPRDLLTTAFPPARLQFSGPVGIWGDAIRTWLSLGGGVRSDPSTYGAVLGQPLFWNERVLDGDNQPLGRSRHAAALLAVGVSRVRDLWDRDAAAPFTAEVLQLSATALDYVRGAIPERWLVLLRAAPVPTVGRCFLLVEAAVPDGVVDLDDARPLHVAVTDSVGVEESDPAVACVVSPYGEAIPVATAPDEAMFDMDRSFRTEARLVQHEGTSFYDGTLETAPVAAASLTMPTGEALDDGTPSVVTLDSITTRITRAAMVAASMPDLVRPVLWSERTAPQTPDWTKTWKWARSDKHRTRYQCDLLWLVLHNALPTGHRQQWRPQGGRCPYGCDAMETSAHLLLDCPISLRAWRPALHHWRGLSGLAWPVSPHLVAFGRPHPFVPSLATRKLLPTWDRIHACTVHVLWAARCRTAIEGAPPPVSPALWADILVKIARQ